MSIKLKGSTDGSVTLQAPADTSPTGTDKTLTLPTTVGSANQFVKNGGTAGELEYSSMVETSTGVGIGTSSPNSFLHVDSDNTYGSVVLSRDGGVAGRRPFGIGISGSTDANLRISASSDTSGANAFDNQIIDITADGKVGIGTSSPAHIVHIADASAPELIVEDTTNNVKALLGADNSVGRVGTDSNHGFTISTNDSERIRVDTSGRVLIGTTSSTGNHKLEVNGGTDNEVIKVESSDAGAYIRFEDDDTTGQTRLGAVDNDFKIDVNSSERLRIFSTGASTFRPDSYGIGVRSIAGSSSVNTAYFGAHSSTSISTGTITFEVYTNGNVKNTNNSYGQLSDERLKENIMNAPSQWDDIKALQIRKYNFREGNGYDTHTQIGLVAQEVETVCPGLVQQTPVREDATPVLDAEGNELEATKSVLTSVLYMKAVKALQEAQTRIETLETQHASLEARLTALEGGS